MAQGSVFPGVIGKNRYSDKARRAKNSEHDSEVNSHALDLVILFLLLALVVVMVHLADGLTQVGNGLD